MGLQETTSHRMKTLLGMVVLAALIGASIWGYSRYAAPGAAVTLRTASVKRADLTSAITATGTLEPEEVIDVGAQVVGRIKSMGPDPSDPQGKKTVDFGSVVKEGALLAQIDDAVYRAQLAQAEAAVVRAQADLLQSQAKLEQAEQAWRRAENLRPSHAIGETDYDLAVANYKSAKATVAVSQASIKQSEAALQLAKTNVDYTVIKSPVDGVIIARRVSVGQTIVSSMNASSIALIAKDLRKMDVWASVNEADIGKIHMGQAVRFTVDAFPKETFLGKVKQIRFNASMTQNVVTYTVVVGTDNSSMKLLPYLTANLQFEVESRTGALCVPNGALRWKPRAALVAPEFRDALSAAKGEREGKEQRKAGAADDAQGGRAQRAAKSHEQRGRIWVKADELVRPIEVRMGITDGVATEISGEGVQEGLEAVVGEEAAADAASDTTNPFAPKLPGRGMRGRM